MYYNSGSTAKIKITNSKTGKAVAGVYVFVRLYTSSTKYNDYLFMTNSKGVVEFSAPLDVGKHKMIVATADTRYEGSSVTKTITVKNAPAKITAAKKTAYYKQGKYFVVKVTNTKNNKPIYNAKLNIRVFVTSTKYYNFNGRTGANGQIKLSMDLKPGTYNVVIIDKDSNMVAKQATSKMVIKNAPAKFSASKVTAKKKANKYFKVKVINKKTKKIIPGVKVKVKVYTGKKSKTYTIKTNSKGIAKLSTKSLKVGNHKVVITSSNKYVKASKKTSSIKITK
jgi:DNA-binding transcriptional regulator of glucitol operon